MNERDNPRDEFEDRWTDQALREVVGGKRPPDLTARILAAAQPRPFAFRPRRMMLTLAASLLAVVTGIGGYGIFAVYWTHRNWTGELRNVEFVKGAAGDAGLKENAGDATRDRHSPDFTVLKPEFETKTKTTTLVVGGRSSHHQPTVEKGYYKGFAWATGSHVSATDEPPIHYPDPEVWRQLAERRRRFTTHAEQLERHSRKAVMDTRVVNAAWAKLREFDELLANGDYASLKIHAALDEDTAIDFDEQPLQDVIDYLMARHDIEIQLDARVLADSGVGTDQTITRHMKGITLNSALRSLLSDLDLAYVIKDEVLMITTKKEAENIRQRLADEGHGPGEGGDRYARIVENPFLNVTDNPLSTFSIDVDTASYAKTRRYIDEEGRLPPPDAVRIEEFVNYFSYDYAPPEGNLPFSAHVEVAACPWQPEHRLLRIGLKGKEIARDDRPAANLVFLLDVSGSMQPEDKLPRVRRAMHLLVEQLREQDRVAIVVYAAASGLVLPSTSGFRNDKIAAALDALEAGGSTNGGDGIRLAYDTAQAGFIKGGTNRVVLCTDGDFNVGTTSTAELERLVEERAKGGVFLTVLGFGMGNHNDEMMEKLADKGNGNYGYVDSEQEARKLLVEQAGATLVTIAKDVKLQLEFNPLAVGAYRLIGYEDRLLRAEDFNDDKKDAGEIGAGHTVTALYELVPPGKPVETPEIDELKYQRPAAPTEAAAGGELLTLKLRYKDPDSQASHEPLVVAARDEGHGFAQATADFKFASAVAGFGLLLRGSEFEGNLTYAAVLELAGEGRGPDPNGHRTAFIELVKKTKTLAEE